MKNLFTLMACIFLVTIMIFPKDLQAGNGQIMFVAKLNSANEIPMVRDDALGLVTFLLSEDRKEVLIHGLFVNLTGTLNACQIHKGKNNENGPVYINLSSYVTGGRIKAKVPLPKDFLELALSGQLYINVFTTLRPGGEMRGQLTLMAETIIPVFANGLNQVPPDSLGSGYGLGTLRFSQNLTRMEYQIMPIGLSGSVVAAHIHKGSSGVNGPVIVGLNAGDLISGTIEDSLMVKSVFQEILIGNAYVNIHTLAKPDGEIRSQLQFHTVNNGSAILNGDQEVPPVNTTAKAYAYTALNATLDSISYSVVYSGITPLSAHIHQGDVGIDGTVAIPLKLSKPGVYSGSSILGADVLTSFLKDEVYFNIHSANNPGGEIRGQLQNNLMNSYAFDLCGEQENPKKNVNGYGAAYVAYNKANTELDYGIITDGLNGDATSTRIYDGAFGSNGTTLLSLDLPNPFVTKVATITGKVSSKISMDRGYVNIHTAANPSGEIRGQVRRSLSCLINTGNQEGQIKNISLIQNYDNQTLSLETDFDKEIKAQIILTDLSGKSMLQWSASFTAGENKESYSIESLSSGFYMLNIIHEKKIIGTFKIIKI